ncbi:hypothetical protein CPB83DRAFT_167332 [Crepidotus variabilis]|uniref:Hemerythrin-like domain-containing protein n=1 Tax=Crepidotus variabilis TaxID=179855 RepID=A0A9P6EK67_9AGAR|nr:hypothetical protein CPB83DRAFT_167332 [Crepidotus variabilis]
MSSEREQYALLPVPWSPETNFKDHVATLATEMICVHNSFIRCLNNMYYYAPRVKKGDEASFVGYCLMFLNLLHNHHSIEEELVFPVLQTKLDMTPNIEQHKSFHEGMDNFERYLKDVQDKKEVYDGDKLVGLLDGFSYPLVEHLNDEIPTLSPERLAQLDKAQFEGVCKELEEHIKSSSMTTLHSFITVHHDSRTAPSWPPAPKLISWFISNVAYWRHSNLWKFAPFNRHCQPQEYA